eukprot:XP_020400213.1 uncharacterized protein LOC109942547 [Zea mays]
MVAHPPVVGPAPACARPRGLVRSSSAARRRAPGVPGAPCVPSPGLGGSPASPPWRGPCAPAHSLRRGGAACLERHLRATRDSPARSPGSASARRGLRPASAWHARGRPAQPAREKPPPSACALAHGEPVLLPFAPSPSPTVPHHGALGAADVAAWRCAARPPASPASGARPWWRGPCALAPTPSPSSIASVWLARPGVACPPRPRLGLARSHGGSPARGRPGPSLRAASRPRPQLAGAPPASPAPPTSLGLASAARPRARRGAAPARPPTPFGVRRGVPGAAPARGARLACPLPWLGQRPSRPAPGLGVVCPWPPSAACPRSSSAACPLLAFATPGVARSRPLLDVECLLRLSSSVARSQQPARFARGDSLARVAGPSPARLHRLVRGTANPFTR